MIMHIIQCWRLCCAKNIVNTTHIDPGLRSLSKQIQRTERCINLMWLSFMVIDSQIQLKEHFGHYIPCHFYLPISRA